MGTGTIKQYLDKFHSWINGAPNGYLSAALVIVAAFAVYIALFAPAEMKAIVLAWLVLP